MERLIVNAAEIGIRGKEFWGMSATELQLQFRGAQQRMDGLYKLAMWTAWHVAMFSRADKLPKLKTVLAGMDRKSAKPSKRQQRAVLQQVADRLGLTVKRVPKRDR